MLPRCAFDLVPSTFLPMVSGVFPVSMMQPCMHVNLCCTTEPRVNSKHLFWPSSLKTNILYIKCNSSESCSIILALSFLCFHFYLQRAAKFEAELVVYNLLWNQQFLLHWSCLTDIISQCSQIEKHWWACYKWSL